MSLFVCPGAVASALATVKSLGTHSVHDLLAVAPPKGVRGVWTRQLFLGCVWKVCEAMSKMKEPLPQLCKFCWQTCTVQSGPEHLLHLD